MHTRPLSRKTRRFHWPAPCGPVCALCTLTSMCERAGEVLPRQCRAGTKNLSTLTEHVCLSANKPGNPRSRHTRMDAVYADDGERGRENAVNSQSALCARLHHSHAGTTQHSELRENLFMNIITQAQETRGASACLLLACACMVTLTEPRVVCNRAPSPLCVTDQFQTWLSLPGV